tara:strand:- start:537 stop:713 length:177 start_codon:yes stop_codon:yes gene_type:complete
MLHYSQPLKSLQSEKNNVWISTSFRVLKLPDFLDFLNLFPFWLNFEDFRVVNFKAPKP